MLIIKCVNTLYIWKFVCLAVRSVELVPIIHYHSQKTQNINEQGL